MLQYFCMLAKIVPIYELLAIIIINEFLKSIKMVIVDCYLLNLISITIIK